MCCPSFLGVFAKEDNINNHVSQPLGFFMNVLCCGNAMHCQTSIYAYSVRNAFCQIGSLPLYNIECIFLLVKRCMVLRDVRFLNCICASTSGCQTQCNLVQVGKTVKECLLHLFDIATRQLSFDMCLIWVEKKINKRKLITIRSITWKNNYVMHIALIRQLGLVNGFAWLYSSTYTLQLTPSSVSSQPSVALFITWSASKWLPNVSSSQSLLLHKRNRLDHMKTLINTVRYTLYLRA